MQEALKKEINSTLNRLIESQGISQTVLSEKTGIPKTTINGYIKGTSLPTPSNIEKIDPRFRTNILDHMDDKDEIISNESENFVQPVTFSLDEYAKENHLTELELNIMKDFMALDKDVREAVLNFAQTLINSKKRMKKGQLRRK